MLDQCTCNTDTGYECPVHPSTPPAQQLDGTTAIRRHQIRGEEGMIETPIEDLRTEMDSHWCSMCGTDHVSSSEEETEVNDDA